MKIILFIQFLLLSFIAPAQNPKLLIGTFTNGESKGIYVYDFDTVTAENHFIRSVSASNPSFLAISPDKKFVYAVNEDHDSLDNGGTVTAYKFNRKKGTLNLINQQSTKGNDPCYVCVDKTGRWAVAANYGGGSFSILPVNKDGSVGAAINTIHDYGKSLNKQRQEKSHVHSAVFSSDNKHLYVADLGIDKLLVYAFDETNGNVNLDSLASVTVSAGSGPRHIALHPSQKFVYLTEELSGTVAAFSVKENNKLKLFQAISAAPENYTGNLSGADIHVSKDGRFLYASNRGELNDIVIFAIDPATGILSVTGRQSTLGVKPRNFNFDPSGNFLLAANQDSDTIVIFSVNHQTGMLKDTGKRISVPNPVCIIW